MCVSFFLSTECRSLGFSTESKRKQEKKVVKAQTQVFNEFLRRRKDNAKFSSRHRSILLHVNEDAGQ